MSFCTCPVLCAEGRHFHGPLNDALPAISALFANSITVNAWRCVSFQLPLPKSNFQSVCELSAHQRNDCEFFRMECPATRRIDLIAIHIAPSERLLSPLPHRFASTRQSHQNSFGDIKYFYERSCCTALLKGMPSLWARTHICCHGNNHLSGVKYTPGSVKNRSFCICCMRLLCCQNVELASLARRRTSGSSLSRAFPSSAGW